MCEPNRWLLAFVVSAWLLPPFPISLGSSGPHIALLFAALGAFAGVLTFFRWRVEIDHLSGTLLLLFSALLISCMPAFLYSGAAVGAGALMRVLLFGISVYAFLFVRDGPFQFDNSSVVSFLRVIFWSAAGSAVLACLDFYFQLPTGPGHSEQFIWLESTVYRRAQGVFYEASTLGNLSVFILVMILAAWVEPRVGLLRRWVLISGAVPLVIALVMSYSRGSLVSLGVACLCLLAIKGQWGKWKRTAGFVLGGAAASGIVAFAVSPALARFAWVRIAASMQYIWIAPNAVLSGRLSNWSTLANFILEEPWRVIFGVGYKTLAYSGISGTPVIADNTYLSMLVEAGVMGLIALIALNATILWRCYEAVHSTTPLRSFLGLWMFCFWMGETVQMLTGDLLTYWRVIPVFFCVVALMDRKVA